jgi:putative SOS response-associated peptidase YedK
MCGRFTLSEPDPQFLAEVLGVQVELLLDYRPRYNIAPTDEHWIARIRYEEREPLRARWGLVNSWTKPGEKPRRQINARAETVETSGAFREAFLKRRCVVAADGFFEWTGPKEARQPLWFHRPDGRLFLFAGLYETWQPQPGERERTFTILTTGANALMAPVHDRMPVILPEDTVDAWLDPRNQDRSGLRRLLVPAPEDLLVATPVSPLANSVKNDVPEVLQERQIALL